jgi:murein DD-endopeptidase MepM/ murein hydrolase activator NlpD
MDIGAPCGTPVRASASGTVAWARYLYSYGNQVLVNHGWVNGAPLATSYSHLSGFAVRPGQYVSRGDVVGYIGTTGSSTGCHLHWMVYRNGQHTNPANYLY